MTCPLNQFARRTPRPTTQLLISSQHSTHDVPIHIGETVIAALEAERELGVVETELVQQRRVQIVDVDRVARDVVAEIIRLTVV